MKQKLYTTLLSIVLFFSAVIAYAQPAGYLYVRQITIHESQVPDGASLNNFPYLFKTTNADFRSVANGGHIASNNGYDILFYQNSCSDPLDYQLDYYNPSTGEIAVWIRIPGLSTTIDTRVYMYYGNNTVAAPLSVATTWDAGYSGIWHLGNDPSGAAPQITDATVNSHHGTSYGSMVSANLVNGKIGRALSFDEVNDHIRIPDFLYGQELTVSFWFNASEVNGNSYQYLFSHGAWATPNSLNVYLGEDNITIPAEVHNLEMLKTVFRDNNDANNFDTLDAGNSFVDGGWHYYTMRIQNTGGAYIFIDGVQVAVYSVWGANTVNPTTDIFLAAREDLNAGRYYGGMLDEVRISSVWRTANWIRTEYNNQNDPASFSLLGIEGPSAGFCFPLAINIIDFTAVRSGNAVKLAWKVPASYNTADFIIERSADGEQWQSIGESDYADTFTDVYAPGGELYYRLRLVEGAAVYISVVRKVNRVTDKAGIRIYPNPSPDGEVYIIFPDAVTVEKFTLYDISGKLIQEVTAEKKQTGTYLLRINGTLKRGLYLIRFQYKNRQHTKPIYL